MIEINQIYRRLLAPNVYSDYYRYALIIDIDLFEGIVTYLTRNIKEENPAMNKSWFRLGPVTESIIDFSKGYTLYSFLYD